MPKQPATFATRLRTLRTEAGLSQSELSRRTGITQATLSRLEKGQEPAWSTACRLADGLGCSTEDFRRVS